MDAFEQLISEVLWLDGYWVRTSVKVELTKEEKCAIGRPSSPRWELDIVAYRGATNSLRVVECKSYLDSKGVQAKALTNPNDPGAVRYKLFHDVTLRKAVFGRLAQQFTACGACAPNPAVSLGLACGKLARESDRPILKAHFEANDWELLDEIWLRDRLRNMANGGYENQVSAVVAKLLLRGKVE